MVDSRIFSKKYMKSKFMVNSGGGGGGGGTPTYHLYGYVPV